MDSDKKKILIVDDEVKLLKMLKKALYVDQDFYEVILADNADKAIEILADEEIALVVSDIKMPGMSGIELFAIIRVTCPNLKVIFMTAYATDMIRKAVEDNSRLLLMEKPFNHQQLREMIHEILGEKKTGFDGVLKDIELTDIIQMCCLSSGDVSIRVSKGLKTGIIVIKNGEIIHSECNGLKGENAFYEIISWEGGKFEILKDGDFQVETISKDWKFLLIEGARLSDELFKENL
ncbi:MAG: response regulator [Deltaproteobacteria bacterium]|nr:response regulator [Deltaproteobacteria bacterium]